ncbi:hypothetical protein SAMN06296241_3142 [Salinimicrobium sediminis]|uniref:Uncharacterized protein n=1 Tax=Salinimicrobium sediminis TaxID=1343891 RepID=A0A285X8B6_9FLAO|nr:hypothetical protein [Salinimicrobium sediminis]SOC81563.1 hypothetical protein SAMN06296241_3142 [Salinimicrobium sediminis]
MTIFQENKRPLKTKEILRLLEKNHSDLKVSKKEINKIIWNDLKDLIIYDLKDYKYSLKDVKQMSLFDSKDLNTTDIVDTEWKIIFDNSLSKPVHIDFCRKELVFQERSENLHFQFETFVGKLFKQRSKHRNPEVDLFFENFEIFYGEL